jgi:RNA polymerase sigma-70 factor, ECF subfamily
VPPFGTLRNYNIEKTLNPSFITRSSATMPSSFDSPSEFIDLFLKAEPRLYAFIRSQIPHRADAEDVLQETAVTLWSKFSDFERGSNFTAWAHQIARFKIQHYRKKQTRRRSLFSNEFVSLVATRSEEMSKELESMNAMLAECMSRLAAADREVLQMCYGSDTTIAALAKQLGRPVNTIKSVLKRSRKSLYDCIQRAIRRENRE